MKLLVLFVCLCLALANAKPFISQSTPFAFVNPTQYTVPNYQFPVTTGQVIPTFKTATYPTQYTVPNYQFPITTGQVIPTFKTETYPTQYTVPNYQFPISTGQVIPTFKTATPVSSTFPFVFNKFHTQDPNGAYTFSYSGGPSSRTESRDQFGTVVGAFNYIDPEGKVQTQQYVADKEGFRVAGTNLPVEKVVTVKETPISNTETINVRTKRDATTFVGKTPASTVPLNTVAVHQIVPQTYTNKVVSPIFPNYFTINRNVIPNIYTPTSQVPVTTFPFSTYPTVYTIPTGVPTPTDKVSTVNEKIETVPFTPTVYTGVNTPIFPFNPNFFTGQFDTKKTTGTGFTYYY